MENEYHVHQAPVIDSPYEQIMAKLEHQAVEIQMLKVDIAMLKSGGNPFVAMEALGPAFAEALENAVETTKRVVDTMTKKETRSLTLQWYGCFPGAPKIDSVLITEEEYNEILTRFIRPAGCAEE